MASVQAEVRELVDAIRSGGFQCAIERDGHWHVYRHGRPVMKVHGGPVTLPSSPSDARWRDNTIAMLRDARVLTVDPRKADQMRLAQRDPELRQMREDMRQRMLPKEPKPGKVSGRREADDRTIAARKRVAAALETLGVPRAEFVRLAMKVGAAKGMKLWKSENSGQQALLDLTTRNVKLGGWVLDLIEAALDDIGAEPVAVTPAVEKLDEYKQERAEPKEKKQRRAPAQDPRLPDLRSRIKALGIGVPQFAAKMIEEGKRAGIRTPPNQKAGETCVHRILRGGGANPWVVELLATAVPALESEKRRAEQVLAGMRDLGQVPVPEPTPEPAPPAPPVPEPVATNGHVTKADLSADQLHELVLLARLHGLLIGNDVASPDVADLGKLVEKKVAQLVAE